MKKVRNERSFIVSSAEISYAPGVRALGLICFIAIAGCNSEIYVREGVTDGDTFYLAERAITDDDAVLQSWVSYSLTKSACQLQIGGPNPARTSSFDCELMARRLLLETWTDKQVLNPLLSDTYLDELVLIHRAGYLDEYVARNFHKAHWQLPNNIDIAGYRIWRRENVPSHKPKTRLVGSWNYARKVAAK